jgi:F-type H+-transporting ATPase subunit b
VKRAPWIRRAAVLAIVLVTAWSLWASAQPKRPGGPAAKPSATVVAAPARPAPPPEAKESKGAGEEGKEAKEKEEDEHAAPGAINWLAFGGSTPPFVAMVINFGILVAAYYLLGKRPIAAALQGRRDAIAKDIEEAQRMKQEAETRAKTYQAKLEHLEEEMRQAREALVRAGEAERDRILREAEANAERMRKDAQFLVEQELKQVRQDLWCDTVDTAIAAAEELLKKRVTAADQERLAEDYLADLGGKSRSAGAQESARPAEPGAGGAS